MKFCPFFFLAVIPPSQWKLPGEMVEFRSGEGHRPASQPEGGFHGACLSASWCLSLSCVRPPLVTRYLFSHVMRHVGACLQSLYLLSLLKTRTRCIYLLRQSPLSNGSLREEGQHPPICPQICGQTCLPWICLWPPTVIFTINKSGRKILMRPKVLFPGSGNTAKLVLTFSNELHF